MFPYPLLKMEDLQILEYELKRRQAFEPLRFFRPNTAQERFINAIAEPESKIILFPAGNWVGKTAGAIATLASVTWPELGEHSCFRPDVFKRWPWPKRARIVSTPKELEIIGSVQTEIKKWWPPNRYTLNKHGKNYPCEFVSDS